MSEVRISAEPRTEFGKGGARRTRRAGKIPAVLYGHGEKPKHVALPAHEFTNALRHGGANQLFTIELADGARTLALPKALQRDPIKDTIDHVDLLIVRRGEKVAVEVAVHITGEMAKEADGLVVQELDTLAVNVEATHVPEQFEVSIEGLGVGDKVLAGQVPLPAGSELTTDPEATVVAIVAAPTAAQVEADTSGEAAEAPAPAAEESEKVEA
ncbi:50S ribosomal protein L25 [Actinocatenispora thailandica]|uniref:Large ribosomal subunit protein bL25 n=1 Tax=Actinocatenispora thailandica TaxID=227318 RepID=A0A7R7DJT3_9ACTN|nr:50S ribosomal protein L25/general stress protein Ctc [Actinocatenispora thailandica]BCJ32955.1 50S ribosomal protein L25 [Actinocatenispora thailandica]